MQKFAFSALARQQSIVRNVVNHRHTVAVLEAVSVEEAEGKAMRIGKKLFPESDGWVAHHVVACPVENVVDFDGVRWVPSD